MTSVSNAGRRRGRAKGLMRKRDLNKGQIIGVGKIPIQFPGLNTPVFRGRELIQQQKLPVDPEREEKLAKLRQNYQTGPKRMKLSPLERGWTSAQMGGRKIGPPDPIGEGYLTFLYYAIRNQITRHNTSDIIIFINFLFDIFLILAIYPRDYKLTSTSVFQIHLTALILGFWKVKW